VVDVRIARMTIGDYRFIKEHVDDWWGRPVRQLLLPLFFHQLGRWSYVASCGSEVIGFILGFRAQRNPLEAYIHMVGVHPRYRRMGIASNLYLLFFSSAVLAGCGLVKAITTPANQASIFFHRSLGFRTVGAIWDAGKNVFVEPHYAGQDDPRVVFVRPLGANDLFKWDGLFNDGEDVSGREECLS